MFFVISFIMMIVGSITQTTILLADNNELTYKLLDFINTANIFTTTVIGKGTAYTLKELIYLIVPNLTFTVLFIVFGLVAFKKKDLK